MNPAFMARFGMSSMYRGID